MHPLKDCRTGAPAPYATGLRIDDLGDRLQLENGDIRFNAFRIETDGGEMEKHLFALKPTLQPRFHVPQCFVPLQEYLSL